MPPYDMTMPSTRAPAAGAIPIATHLDAAEIERARRDDVRRGLISSPKDLPPKWLYDERGCELFEEITRLAEYYPTRTERSILAASASEIVRRASARTLIELGSGTSEKTRLLLDALATAGTLERFVGFDVAEPTLRRAGESIAADYPGVDVEGVVGDFERHLHALPSGQHRMVAFLGGTIGNLTPDKRSGLYASLLATLGPSDSFLVGTDLQKDRRRLLAAYDDASGVTAAFNKNVLAMINRELGGHFSLEEFDHVVAFDEESSWIEMRLRSRRTQIVSIDALDLEVGFAAGEEMRTEISTKFDPEAFATELSGAGFATVECWTDPRRDFALWLARPEAA